MFEADLFFEKNYKFNKYEIIEDLDLFLDYQKITIFLRYKVH